ncbi:hypothetical protein NKI48_31765 [Mesorhizobium sp. M0644]
MTLPFVTRRQVLAGAMITPAALVLEKNAVAGNVAATKTPPSDPALAVWLEWEKAHKLTEQLCQGQQRLETQLVHSVGFPCVSICLPEGEDVTLHSIEALHSVLGKGAGYGGSARESRS